jgi:single-stranded-DNA-specific exonuclease
VSFRLAPRINAPGRLDKPDLALSLLLARDDHAAQRLAGEVETQSARRKEIQNAVLAEALETLSDPALAGLPAIVLAKQGWHPGVVGIVAGRLASRFGKPTVVIALDGAKGRGSARGPAGFSVYEALAKSRDALIGFGGHHAAAGVEIASDRVDALRDRFCAACVAIGVPDAAGPFDADARLDDGDAPARVVADLDRFEPCGQSNPSPRIAIDRVRVLGTREIRGGHLRIWIDVRGAPLSCFGPEMGGLAARLGTHASVAGVLRRDAWKGGDAVEMRLAIVEPS